MNRKVLFKSFNSKGFLLLYLLVFACLLAFWLFTMAPKQVDNRDIPPSLQAFLYSPPKELPQFLLYSASGEVFTDQSLRDVWSFIYFTHPACLPQCEPVLSVMNNLQQLAAVGETQFVMINFDSQQQTERPEWWQQTMPALPFYGGKAAMIDQLARAFDFIFLRTPLNEQVYHLEQQHSLFLTDPRGRLYARFEPPFSSPWLQEQFLALREFHARSE